MCYALWFVRSRAAARPSRSTNRARTPGAALDNTFEGERRATSGVDVRQETDRIWLVSFMHYDLGYFDDETCRLESLQNPFGPIVLPLSPEWTC